jgi:hypothetical protein
LQCVDYSRVYTQLSVQTPERFQWAVCGRQHQRFASHVLPGSLFALQFLRLFAFEAASVQHQLTRTQLSTPHFTIRISNPISIRLYFQINDDHNVLLMSRLQGVAKLTDVVVMMMMMIISLPTAVSPI